MAKIIWTCLVIYLHLKTSLEIMSDFVPQMRNNEKENIGQWLPFLQIPSVVSTFVPVYFMEVFFYSNCTQQITPLTLSLLFFFLLALLLQLWNATGFPCGWNGLVWRLWKTTETSDLRSPADFEVMLVGKGLMSVLNILLLFLIQITTVIVSGYDYSSHSNMTIAYTQTCSWKIHAIFSQCLLQACHPVVSFRYLLIYFPFWVRLLGYACIASKRHYRNMYGNTRAGLPLVFLE